MNGFSFAGRHCSEFGQTYLPSPSNIALDAPDYDLRESTVTGKHGGYYYGFQAKIREFQQDCYFEDVDISKLESIYIWLHVGSSGVLVFDERKFVEYDVIPSKRPTLKSYTSHRSDSSETRYSGTMTVYFKSYDPFGKMKYITYDGFDSDGASKYCGIIEKSKMPSPISPILGTQQIYNPGTEKCNAIIRIGGTAPNGLSIECSSGDKCSLFRQPTEGYLEIDGCSGIIRQLPIDRIAFEYHNDGYIHLDPSMPIYKNIAISYTEGSNAIDFVGSTIDDKVIGKYIYIDNAWTRIVGINNEKKFVINKRMNVTGMELSDIVNMNEISIDGEGAQLTRLEIDYTPLLR